MPITVTCPKCGAVVRGGDHLAGQVSACPRCRVPIRLPDLVEVDEDEDEDDGPRYGWNNWQIAAFIGWGVGAILILIPLITLLIMGWPSLFAHFRVYLIPLLVGILVVAGGNILHKIGTGRERRDY
jgi:hypothetical protein